MRQSLTLLRHEQIDVLDYVEEQFITSVLNAFTTPANLSSHLRRNLRLLLLRLQMKRAFKKAFL